MAHRSIPRKFKRDYSEPVAGLLVLFIALAAVVFVFLTAQPAQPPRWPERIDSALTADVGPTAPADEHSACDHTRPDPLEPRALQVVESVLRFYDRESGDRLYYLTVSPMCAWSETGDWIELPEDFHARIRDFPIKYWRASAAVLSEEMAVLDRESGAPGWMRWVTVINWPSDSTAEVEHGVWCCHLGGGASRAIFRERHGRWDFLEDLPGGWISQNVLPIDRAAELMMARSVLESRN